METTQKRQHELAVMDVTGDSKQIWDPDNADEVEVAQQMFNSLRKKGYRAFSVQANGSKGELINKFDATLGKIIMVPPVAGG